LTLTVKQRFHSESLVCWSNKGEGEEPRDRSPVVATGLLGSKRPVGAVMVPATPLGACASATRDIAADDEEEKEEEEEEEGGWAGRSLVR